MIDEVFGRHRRAAELQVGRRRADHGTCLEQAPRDQRRIGEPADTDRQVRAFRHEIDTPVVEIELERHSGVQAAECGDRFRHVAHPERQWQRDAQNTAQLAMFLCGCRLRLVQIGEYPGALLVEALAGLGQVQPSRGAAQ